MARRSDNPLTILAMGIFLLAGFGVALVLLTEKTPILRLRPVVEKEFPDHIAPGELRTRFRPATPGRPAAIELTLPPTSGFPPERHVELAEFALRSYIDLALKTDLGRTSVQQLEVWQNDQVRFVLSRTQLESKAEAERQLPALPPLIERLGFKDVELSVAGYSRSGIVLHIRCLPVRDGLDLVGAARRAIAILRSRTYVGSIVIEVGGPTPAKVVGGRDTPMTGKRRRRRPPPRRSEPAPVESDAVAPVESGE